MESKFEVHQDDPLSKALAEAYRVQYTDQSLLLPLFAAHFFLLPSGNEVSSIYSYGQMSFG